MNKNLIILTVFLLSFTSKILAQNPQINQDTAQFKNSGILYKGVHYAKPKDIEAILLKEPNDQIPTFLESYKSNRGVANVLAGIGGFGIGWSLGGLIGGNKSFDTGIFAGGAGVLLIGIIVNGSANNKLRQAVAEYNKKTMERKISFIPVFYQGKYNQMNAGIALRF
jgi:hypothetical protein